MHEAQSLHMNLLQALLCAGIHSRASYGYAMAAGHLSSLLNFALLQTVQSPHHPSDHCLCPSQKTVRWKDVRSTRNHSWGVAGSNALVRHSGASLCGGE